MKDRYYFAYGSNMNLEQMKYRCPAAEVVENVRLENYRLAFRGRAPGNGVATVLPEKGSYVEGVLWKITEACEKSLDFYEGFPSFYGKESIRVKNQDGVEKEVFVYMMNVPMQQFWKSTQMFTIYLMTRTLSITTRIQKENGIQKNYQSRLN